MPNSVRRAHVVRRSLWALGWGLFMLLVCAPVGAEPLVKRFALVVGATQGAPPLQFSDDDAVNLADVLRAADVETELLVLPDEETLQLHPSIDFLKVAPPTFSNVIAALRRLVQHAKDAKLAEPRARVEVFFSFSGHGSAGALVLHDPRPLTGAILQTELLGPTRAARIDAVHLLIDACSLVSDSAAGSFADALELSKNPHTGLILALTDQGQSLEWDKIGAGVFSYELRSALLSAADLVGHRTQVAAGTAEPNSRVEYREVGAFVSTANEGVKDSSARMLPAQRPPNGNLEVPLLTWDPSSHSYTQLLVPPQTEVWVRVSDATVQTQLPGKLPRRLLLAEFHLGSRQKKATILRLPRRTRYHVQILDPRGGPGELREFEPARDGDAAELQQLRVVPGTRGGLAEALKDGLFRLPYDERSIGSYNPVPVAGHHGLTYIGNKGPLQAAAPDRNGPWPEVLCIATGVAATFTGVAYVASNNSYHSWQHASSAAEYNRLEAQTARWDWLTTIGLATTAAAGAGCTGTLLHAWLAQPNQVTAGATGAGAELRLRF